MHIDLQQTKSYVRLPLSKYNFVNSKNVYAGLIQTETAYYQPSVSLQARIPPVTETHCNAHLI